MLFLCFRASRSKPLNHMMLSHGNSMLMTWPKLERDLLNGGQTVGFPLRLFDRKAPLMLKDWLTFSSHWHFLPRDTFHPSPGATILMLPLPDPSGCPAYGSGFIVESLGHQLLVQLFCGIFSWVPYIECHPSSPTPHPYPPHTHFTWRLIAV